MNKLKIIIPLVFLASCNSYYFPLLVETPQRIVDSFKPYSPGESYIQNQKSSFVTVELGQQNATLVLSSIENNIFTWVGRGNVTFKTYKGLIISTIGLEHNFNIIDPIASIERVLGDGGGDLSYNFDNPRLYELQMSSVNLMQSKDQIELDLRSYDINWDAEIAVGYGPEGLPLRATQSLHPFLKPAKLSFYYKY
tara:strand:- start:657 stop:1241 length:585 start_codon:yes stop_codon:yes gene_type:complete